MALNVVIEPIGLDARVKALQTDLFNELTDLWGISSTDYDSYPLCHRVINRDEGYIPMHLTSNNKDYIDVLHNDKYKLTSFFGLNDTGIQHDGVNHETANIHLVFMANLDAIKGSVNRSDIDIRRDVYTILKRAQYSFELEAEVIGVDRVLSEYSGIARRKIFSRADMRPNHCFRFDLTCTYNPKTVVNFS